MFLQFTDNNLGGKLLLTNETERFQSVTYQNSKLIHILWNRSQAPVIIKVDGVAITLEHQSITTLTFLQKTGIPRNTEGLSIFSFNREFYCIHTHDQEVSCNGIIFFGAQQTPLIKLDEEEAKKFEMLYHVFQDEFSTSDNIQGEMLQMLLKRLIIKTTRLAKEQHISKDLPNDQVETIRKFNALVDMHFRNKRYVADYADLLFKSPKTLSNLFAKHGDKTPLQIIHERIILEAKRQLLYTEKTVKEIAQELGFNEVASFHKMFKKTTGTTPQQFKTDKAKVAS